MKRLLEGLETPEFDSGSEAINYAALGYWASFVKILADMEKDLRGDKEDEQHPQVFKAVLAGMKAECERRLGGSDDIPGDAEDSSSADDSNGDKDIDLDADIESDASEGDGPIKDNTDKEDKSEVADSLITKGTPLTEGHNLSEADTMRRLAGLPPRR